jgi:hypothetical protein
MTKNETAKVNKVNKAIEAERVRLAAATEADERDLDLWNGTDEANAKQAGVRFMVAIGTPDCLWEAVDNETHLTRFAGSRAEVREWVKVAAFGRRFAARRLDLRLQAARGS